MQNLLTVGLAVALLFMSNRAFAVEYTARWTDKSDNEEGFIMQRHCGDGVFVEVGRAPANATSMVVEVPEDETKEENTCTFQVISFNAKDKSIPSNTATVTLSTLPPASPADLILEAMTLSKESLNKLEQAHTLLEK